MTPQAEAILSNLESIYSAPSSLPELPENIYHDTSAAGLYGILTSGVLRASNFSYLNDATEITYGSGVARSALRSYGRESINIDLAEKLLDEVDSYLEFYLSCFCGEPDLLSQWRGYGTSTGRFCVAFDTRKLVRDTPRLKCQLDCVIYDPEEQISKIKTIIDPALEALERSSSLAPGERKQCDKALYLMLIERFIEVFCFFKHRGFHEEKEWRAVHQLDGNVSDIRFEPSDGAIKPFVELFSGVGEPSLLPIREIIVGSSKLSQQAKKSVKMLLDAQGYSGIPVTESEVPFRDL